MNILVKIRMLNSVPIPNYECFEFRDPFGNSVEIIKEIQK